MYQQDSQCRLRSPMSEGDEYYHDNNYIITNSTDNSDVNVIKLFNINKRFNRSRGRRNYHRPKIKSFSLSGTFDDLLFYINSSWVLMHSHPTLSHRVTMLKSLRDCAFQKPPCSNGFVLNLSNTLNNKKVTSHVRNQTVPIVSGNYTNNYKEALQGFNLDEYL